MDLALRCHNIYSTYSTMVIINTSFVCPAYKKSNLPKLNGVTISFSVVLRPNAGHGLLILDDSRSNTTTHLSW